MFQLFAMLIAGTGLALTTAGPNCSMCTESKACSMCASHEEAKAPAEACCDDGTCDHCQEMKSEAKAQAYDAASWPAHNKDIYSKDFQGQTLPVALGNETWLSDSVDTEGKVVVLDFWATWCPPCRAASPILDELQKENPDTLAVMAIAGQRDPEKDVRAYVAKHAVSYANLFDKDQTVYSKFESRGIPLVVVMSTDGIIRWIGNPHDEAFLPAVNKTIAADPMIQTQASAQATAHDDG